MMDTRKISRAASLTASFLIAVLGALTIQGCGPVALGAALSGGGGGGGRTPTTENFTESEPNETGLTANVVGPIFPSRTYVIMGSHPFSPDFDFFRIDATEAVRVQMTLTPNAGSDLVMLVGTPVDDFGGGGAESFVTDLMPGFGFAVGSTELNNGIASYILRLVGQPIPGAPEEETSPPNPTRTVTYVRLDKDGKVVSRTDVTGTEPTKP